MNNLQMIDWAIFVILLISTLLSFKRGFVKEALSLATWVAAMIISRLFSGQVSSLLVDYIETPSLRLGAAYGILIVSTLIVGAMVNNLLSEFVKMTGLGSTDRFLGTLFGLARGGVVVLLLAAGLFYLTPVQDDEWWQQSLLIPYIVSTIEWLGPMLWEQSEQLIETVTEKVT